MKIRLQNHLVTSSSLEEEGLLVWYQGNKTVEEDQEDAVVEAEELETDKQLKRAMK